MRITSSSARRAALRNSNSAAKRQIPMETLYGWLLDKDRRSTVVWGGAAYGTVMIAGYYLWLGFTPAVTLGQTPLLLLQAFVVGVFVTLYLAMTIFFPAWAYRLLGIEIENFKSEFRLTAVRMLALRSVIAQLFAPALFSVLCISSPLASPDPIPEYWGAALNTLIFTGLFIVFMPRTNEFGVKETTSSYLLSIVAIGMFSLLSGAMLLFVYDLAPKDRHAEDWLVLLAWLMVMLLSAALSTMRRDEWLPGILVAFTAFLFLLYEFNVLDAPFKATASVIGIAEPQPVTVIFPGHPSTTCEQVKRALNDSNKLVCDGPNAGVLNDVRLLNTLGDRWVLRENEHSENIIFDGKGMLVKRFPPKHRSKLDR